MEIENQTGIQFENTQSETKNDIETKIDIQDENTK